MLVRVLLCLVALTATAEARCYDAKVNSVWDGDTFRADVMLGMNLAWLDQRVRILRVDAPEVRGVEQPEGERVRDILTEKIGGEVVKICTEERELDAFGRILGHVYYEGIDIGQWMLDSGLVLPYE